MKKHNSYFSLILIFILLFNSIIVTANEETIGFDIKAKSVVLMEASTGKVLFEQNSHERLPPASVTKVMTMLLIMEALENKTISYDDMVITSEYAASMGGSQVFLSVGEQMSVNDMLKSISVASGNDASVAMAEHIAGSEEAFVNAMNKKAHDIGMNDTNFVNCNGLDVENHYTSAFDIALMSRELIKYQKIHEYLTIWIDSLRDGQFGLANTNKLIRFYKGANGIKTGSTGNALYCLSASAKRDDMQLIATVLASPTSKERFYYATKLLDYGFANYTVVGGTTKEQIIGEINVIKGIDRMVEYATEKDFSVLIKKSSKDAVQKKISVDENIMAPIEKGQKVGEIVFILNNEELGRVNLITAREVRKIAVGTTFKKIMHNWMNSRD